MTKQRGETDLAVNKTKVELGVKEKRKGRKKKLFFSLQPRPSVKSVGHSYSVGSFVFNVIRHSPLGTFVLSLVAHRGISIVSHTAYWHTF